MKPYDPILVGRVVRSKRIEDGLVIKELADENISSGTISKIENGDAGVTREKVEYLLNKLGLDFNSISDYLRLKEKELEDCKLKLLTIENIIDSNSPDRALKKLKSLGIGKNHIYFPLVEYLKGKAYVRKAKVKKGFQAKSEKHFLECIRVSDQVEDNHLNLKTAAYTELAISAFKRNEIKEALTLVRQAIETFDHSGERLRYIHYAKFNQILFLERTNDFSDLKRAVDDLYRDIDQINNSSIKIQLHEYKAKIYLQTGRAEEAVEYAKKGLELIGDTGSGLASLSYYLWITLGDALYDLKEYEQTESCYLTTLDLGLDHRHDLLIVSFLKLAQLYMFQDRLNESKEMIDRALQHINHIDNQENAVEVLSTLGSFFIKNNETQEAIEPLEKALQLSKDQSISGKQIEILQKLAHCYDVCDQKEKMMNVLLEKHYLEMEQEVS